MLVLLAMLMINNNFYNAARGGTIDTDCPIRALQTAGVKFGSMHIRYDGSILNNYIMGVLVLLIMSQY